MNKKIVLWFFLAGLVVILQAFNAGPFPGNTNAPGDLTCYRSGCHANNGRGAASPFIRTMSQQINYSNSDTIDLVFGFNSSFNNEHGFQILALDTQNNNVGSWILNSSNKLQVVNGFSNPNKKYLEHTTQGSLDSIWQVEWKAPSSYQGAITFYSSLMASNDNNQNTGDTLYLETLRLNYNQSTALEKHRQKAVAINYLNTVDGVMIKNSGENNLLIETYSLNGSLIFSGNLNPYQEASISLKGGVYIFTAFDLKTNQRLTKKIAVN